MSHLPHPASPFSTPLQDDVPLEDRYEAQYVHQIYQHIAPHFSATRFKPWPVVERFLKDLPPGSVGLDIGCGNGKYMTVNPNIHIIGSDRSSNLVRIAYERKVHDAFVADALDLPHPDRRFDFAISIAVIHHFSSAERRVSAIRSVLGILKPMSNQQSTPGRALIFVWALEQKGSRRGWSEGDKQDVFVPWVLSRQFTKSGTTPDKGANQEQDAPPPQTSTSETMKQTAPQATETYQRYYHLYRKTELEKSIYQAGGVVVESGYERDNWWAICSPSE